MKKHKRNKQSDEKDRETKAFNLTDYFLHLDWTDIVYTLLVNVAL